MKFRLLLLVVCTVAIAIGYAKKHFDPIELLQPPDEAKRIAEEKQAYYNAIQNLEEEQGRYEEGTSAYKYLALLHFISRTFLQKFSVNGNSFGLI